MIFCLIFPLLHVRVGFFKGFFHSVWRLAKPEFQVHVHTPMYVMYMYLYVCTCKYMYVSCHLRCGGNMLQYSN